MLPNNRQNLNPGRKARFLRNLVRICHFTTSMNEGIAHASPFGENPANPARKIARAPCFPALGLPLIRSWPPFVKLKMCFGLSDPYTVWACCSMVTTTEHSPLKRQYGHI